MTKILVRIIVVLILINIAMILTVFAVSQPDENIKTAATEYAEAYCETEYSLATETLSVVSLEFEQEHESANTIPFAVEGTIPSVEIEVFQHSLLQIGFSCIALPFRGMAGLLFISFLL